MDLEGTQNNPLLITTIILSNMYGLLTKIKMAGHWPSSFFVSLSLKTLPISGKGQPRSPKLLLCFLIYWGQISLKCFCSFMNISISSWLALFPPPSLAPTCLKFTDVPSFVPLNGNRIHFLNVHHRSLSSVNNNYFHCKWNKCGLDLDNLFFSRS